MSVRPSQLIAVAALAGGLLLAVLNPMAWSAEAAAGLGLAAGVIGLLATAALPEYVTALLFFFVAVVFAIAPPEVVFAGFHSSAIWLVFGGLVIGVGAKRSGLAERIGRGAAARMPAGYLGIVAGSAALGLALAFLLPSTMGRIMLMMPIMIVMADRFGFVRGRPGRAGMLLTFVVTTQIPAFTILPAAVPAIVLAGASETLYGVSPIYGEYLALHFPVLGALKTVVIVLLAVWLFPDRPDPAGRAPSVPDAEALSGNERLMAILLLVALGLWVTDFLHGVSPAWVALGVAVVCVLPFVGIVPADSFNKDLNFGSIIYVSGVLGLGAVLSSTGAGDNLARLALSLMPLAPDSPAGNFASIVGLSTVTGMLATQPGVPAVLAPLAAQIADSAGLSIEQVLMLQAVGFTTVVLPYQTPPAIIGLALAGVALRDGVKLVFTTAMVTMLILLPLDYLWWRLLGYI